MADSPSSSMRTSADVMQAAMRQWQRDLERPAVPATGIGPLDAAMPGLLAPGVLTVIGARPGVGKTLVGQQIATHVARTRPDLDVLVVSLEMTAEAMARRHAIVLAGDRGIPLHDPCQWRDERDSAALMDGLRDFGRLRIWWYDADAALGAAMGALRARIAQCRSDGRDVGVVMIDYMQLIRSGAAPTRTDEVARASAAIAELAKIERVAVVALAQLNRGVAGTDGALRRPVLSDLRESGTIEQDGAAVLLLHLAPIDPAAILAQTRDVEIIIGKARHWPVRQGHVIAMEQRGLRWNPRDDMPLACTKVLLPEAAKAGEREPALYAGAGKYVSAPAAEAEGVIHGCDF